MNSIPVEEELIHAHAHIPYKGLKANRFKRWLKSCKFIVLVEITAQKNPNTVV